ncbi:MAG: anaerobic sulfatase maturase [Phycisphaerae bacterium]|nr:MAG: anaerobic sulfatase maturase [Phycisphaerae bacterium]
MSLSVISAGSPFHVMTKPIGPICNLDCKYCFYLEKENLYPDNRKWSMPDDVLETYIRQYIQSQPQSEISFAWQGGEPTLLGVRFFQKVVDLQQKHANGKQITNAFQTNGVLLTDEWCRFFRQHRFLIGLSIDGPAELHDAYRVDTQQNPTFSRVMKGLELLKKHGCEFNTLTVVHRTNSQKPIEVYRFLKEIGSKFIQFIPLVERWAPVRLKVRGIDFAEPPHPSEKDDPLSVTEWSVRSRDYGEFLCKIFDEWVRRDVGKIFVQLFDVALGNWIGAGSSLCVFAEKCGRAMAMEHNGDLYACDHYVYPKYHLGNIMNTSLGAMVESPMMHEFGENKSATLPRYCQECEVRFACHGECPKHRFCTTPDGEQGLNYLCPAYKRFFNHIDLPMRIMADLIRSGRPAALIMDWYQQQDRIKIRRGDVQRNDPCPCGSEKKFKKCCGS